MSELDWEDKGYLIDGKKISSVCITDDIVLVANNMAEMETMINELNVAGLKIGLEMNMSRTQVMVNQRFDAGEVNLAGSILQRVDSYVYLGRELNMMNNIEYEAETSSSGSFRIDSRSNEPD